MTRTSLPLITIAAGLLAGSFVPGSAGRTAGSSGMVPATGGKRNASGPAPAASPGGKVRSETFERSLPDLSGLAWIEGDRFLAVSDAKNPGEPRVSLVLEP